MTYPFNSIPTNNPQNFQLTTPIGLQSAIRDPTPQDNTFVPGSEWQNTTTGEFFKCESSTIAGAVWIPFLPSSLVSLTGNNPAPVFPDGLENINVVGDGSTILITGSPGAHTLTASVVANFAKTITGNSGGALAPIGGNWNIVGAPGITTTGAGNTLTISLTSTTAKWLTTSVNIANLAVETGYFCIAPGGALTLGLPVVSVLGDTIRVSLFGAASWQITQAAGQQIFFGALSTTLGVGGSITSLQPGTSIHLVCAIPNTTWVVQSMIGNAIVV